VTYYEYMYSNIYYVVAIISGLVIILIGIIFTPFSSPRHIRQKENMSNCLRKLEKFLNMLTSFFPLKKIRERIDKGFEVTLLEEEKRRSISSFVTLLLAITGLLLSYFLFSRGQLWYARFMLSGMGLILPFYTATLLIDLYRYRITRQIPTLIDEFRGAFVRHNKIRPALKECSTYIDRGLGRIILRASDSVFLEDSLNTLKQQFDNVWFNIFTVLVLNFKENGGELTDQLYRLNRTMTRYNSIERKKSKRLIWYEAFAVAAAFLSIPAIFWMNEIILGKGSVIVDARTNMMISQVMGFSALSLVIVRILRRA
jgi:hypothetical protein